MIFKERLSLHQLIKHEIKIKTQINFFFAPTIDFFLPQTIQLGGLQLNRNKDLSFACLYSNGQIDTKEHIHLSDQNS